MIYLINTIPKYCPQCGTENRWTKDTDNIYDFNQHASMLCWVCNAHFCYIKSADLIKLAEEIGSDLPMYVQEREEIEEA